MPRSLLKKALSKKYGVILIALAAILFWFVAHIVFITIDGLNDKIQQADAAVIFGNEIMPDGSLSDRLKARLDKGIEIYREGFTKTLIVSGGTGKSGFDEADQMQKYLIQKGIPSNAVIMDHEGMNTFATAQNVAHLPNPPQSVILISQYFHISRAKLAFAKFGFNQIYSAHADYYEIRDVYSIIREFFGYYAYLAKPNQSPLFNPAT